MTAGREDDGGREAPAIHVFKARRSRSHQDEPARGRWAVARSRTRKSAGGDGTSSSQRDGAFTGAPVMTRLVCNSAHMQTWAGSRAQLGCGGGVCCCRQGCPSLATERADAWSVILAYKPRRAARCRPAGWDLSTPGRAEGRADCLGPTTWVRAVGDTSAALQTFSPACLFRFHFSRGGSARSHKRGLGGCVYA